MHLKNKIMKILSFLLFFIFLSKLMCFGSISDFEYIWSDIGIGSNNTSSRTTDATLVSSEALVENSLNLESESAILIEQNSGQILYSHNIHQKLRPASVTKVMSILLIMEALDSGKISLTDQIPCSENASSMGGSQIWLDPTETLSVNDMLKAICVVSANDCTVAMAEYLGGSEENFVAMMNEKAKELGMNDTCFKNCHGIDEDGHETSCYDISLMSRELLIKHPDVSNYTTIWMDSLRDGKSELVNTNKLIRNYKGATGLKTGSTSLALYNLSASATRDNLSLIAVIMKAPTTKLRFAEAQKLLDYGFANYSSKELGKKEDIVKTVNVSKGIEEKLDLVFEDTASLLLKKGEEKNITQEITIEENISAPIEKGKKLGEATYYLNGNAIGKFNIVAKEEIKKINFGNMLTHIYSRWFNIIR